MDLNEIHSVSITEQKLAVVPSSFQVSIYPRIFMLAAVDFFSDNPDPSRCTYFKASLLNGMLRHTP